MLGGGDVGAAIVNRKVERIDHPDNSIICLGIKPYYYFISKSVSYLDTFKLFL